MRMTLPGHLDTCACPSCHVHVRAAPAIAAIAGRATEGASCPACGEWLPLAQWNAAIFDAAAEIEHDPTATPVLIDAPRTDAGNADRLVALHGRDLRFCSQGHGWLVWDGKRWSWDESSRVMRLAVDTIRTTRRVAASLRDPEDAERLSSHSFKSENVNRLHALVTIAQALVPAGMKELDADPWLLTVENGTLDLRSGMLREHRREDRITRLAPVAFDAAAPAPLWESTVARALGGDVELIAWLQRWAGYCLTGVTGEHCLALFHGRGRNGKSTIIEALRAVLGDYARSAPVDLFLARQNDAGRDHQLARLAGARLVTAVEPDPGRSLAESVIKSVTGGDSISACFKYRDAFEFVPEFKLILAANHRPQTRGDDEGLWSRIRLVPFLVEIPADERDPELGAKLLEERAGILAWAVAGCLEWQRERLGVPTAVSIATSEYRSSEDTVGAFLGECCDLTDPFARTRSGVLYGAFVDWMRREGEKSVGDWTNKAFTAALEGRKLTRRRAGEGNVFVGIRVQGV